jgi:excisionase family DNA binding protein
VRKEITRVITPADLIGEKKETYSVRDVARFMSVTPATVRIWINTGRLEAYKLPGRGSASIIRIKREQFERFLRHHEARNVVA